MIKVNNTDGLFLEVWTHQLALNRIKPLSVDEFNTPLKALVPEIDLQTRYHLRIHLEEGLEELHLIPDSPLR